MSKEIKEIRTGLGLTQEEFAERLGVRGNSVYRWEAGRVVPSKAILIAARALNVAGSYASGHSNERIS